MTVFDRKERVCVCVRAHVHVFCSERILVLTSPEAHGPTVILQGAKLYLSFLWHKLFSYLFDKNDFSIIKLAAVLVDVF